MTVVRTGFFALLAILAAACSGSMAEPTPQASPAAPSPTSAPEAPPALSPQEIEAARAYADWIVDSFDTIADQADAIVLLLVGADPASEVWLADAESSFQRFADLIRTAQAYEEPEGIFALVHRFYNGGLTEYEAASNLFFVWLDERQEGDAVSGDMMTRFDQGQMLMNESVVPVFRQTQARLPAE